MRSLYTLALSSIVVIAALSAPARSADLRNFEDAALHAVQFWDNREGWAVGDDGVIWHTIDGGKHWERQSSGVRASLRGLHFLDPYTGWVVGREELPNGAGSVGVVLCTKDGGVSWQRLLLNALPGLQRVRFVNEADGYKVGYLVGDGSDAHPSGVFATSDGGRRWQPVPGTRASSWLAAAFADNGDAALVGAWNRLAILRKDRLAQINMDNLGGRSLRDVQLRGDDGLAVGQGGLILRSDGSRGSSWKYVKLPVEENVRRAWDFHALHGVGPHYWVVGRPGATALHSADRGRTWTTVRTGQQLPLNGIYFTDEQHGWAVGELGTIIATGDGGKTWQLQHRGGQRAAVLLIHARAAGIPVDAVAQLGGQEGYLCAALRVTAADQTTAALERSTESARLSAAVRQAGGAAAEMLWPFALPSHLLRGGRLQVLAAWNAVQDDTAAEQLLRQLVLAIRTWQPAVIITDAEQEKDGGFGCDALLCEAVRVAFERAGDAQTFPDQLSGLGLQAWQPAKLYAPCQGRPCPVRLDLTSPAAVLEATPRDFAAGPAALLAGTPVCLPDYRDFQLLAAHVPNAARHHDLMEGTALPTGGLARRDLPPSAGPSPELVKAIRQRATLRALSETQAGGLNDPNRLLSQVGPMLTDMPDDMAAATAFAVAQRYLRTGQWALAREVFLLLVQRYPAHPLAIDSYRWLIRHNSSSEARHRHEMGQFLVVGEEQYGMPIKSGSTLGKPGEANAGVPGIKLPSWKGGKVKTPDTQELFRTQAQSQTFLFATKDQVRQWYQSSLDMEPKLAGFGPLLTADPSLQFCLQAARRNLGDFDAPRKWYAHFAARQPDGPWRSAALAELWLSNRSGAPPKPALLCRFTETRPLLDGRLNEACWQDKPIVLQNAAGATAKDCRTEARFAYDSEFLYLAVQCTHPTVGRVEPVKTRKRDAELRGHDRVSILLDLDRDYCTYYHLQVDQRGCVREDCWGDASWDPRWFVAVHNETNGWTVEAAIPLTALTSDAVTAGKAWACNVVRVLPGQGVQAWSLPAETPEQAPRPEGMGLLIFTRQPNQ